MRTARCRLADAAQSAGCRSGAPACVSACCVNVAIVACACTSRVRRFDPPFYISTLIFLFTPHAQATLTTSALLPSPYPEQMIDEAAERAVIQAEPLLPEAGTTEREQMDAAHNRMVAGVQAGFRQSRMERTRGI
jgi:hypothetical protein